MTALGGVISWVTILGLCWLAALCLIGVAVLADPVYAVFAVLFGLLALALSVDLIRDSGR